MMVPARQVEGIVVLIPTKAVLGLVEDDFKRWRLVCGYVMVHHPGDSVFVGFIKVPRSLGRVEVSGR
jgi:hypothetical protein